VKKQINTYYYLRGKEAIKNELNKKKIAKENKAK